MRFGIFLLLIMFLQTGSAADPLHTGDLFPALEGETLSGQKAALPLAGRAAVIIFSFSRAGGNDSRKWTDRLTKDFPSEHAPETRLVIMLESVPALFRGMALSGIKSMPAQLYSRTLVSYHDEAPWKQRLPVTNTSRSYVVLHDAQGRVRWVGTAGFNESDYAHLKDELDQLR